MRLDPLLAFLELPRAALQVMGPEGHGKATHLLALWRALAGGRYVHLEEGDEAPLPPGGLLLVDDAQRLGRER